MPRKPDKPMANIATAITNTSRLSRIATVILLNMSLPSEWCRVRHESMDKLLDR